MLNKLFFYAKICWEKIANLTNSETQKSENKWWEEFLFYQIKPFKDEENTLAYWQGFLDSIHWNKAKLTFIVAWNSKNIKIYVKISNDFKDFFENNFYSSFKNSELILKKINFPDPKYNLIFKDAVFHTKQDFVKDWIYVDPINNFYSLYYDISVWFQLFTYVEYDFTVSKKSIFINILINILYFIKYVFIKLFFRRKDKEDEKEDKENLIDNQEKKYFAKLWLSFAISWDFNEKNVKNIKKNLKSIFWNLSSSWDLKISKNYEKFNVDSNSLINFFHLPNWDFEVKNLNYLEYKKLSYPWNIPTIDNSIKNDITLLWITDYKNDNIKFGIRNEDKFRHVYVIGKTWMWKSTLISNMARSDMITNKWLAVIDPHWDLVETLLEHTPSWRINDIVLFDVADYKYPIAFNILEYNTEEEKNLVVSGVVGTFKKLYWESWGPRLEYILRNVILSLVDYPWATLLHLIRILKDKNFKDEVVEHLTDPIVIKFRKEEFDKWNDKFKDEAIAPIVNKVGQFLSSPIIRNIFGQSKTQLNIRKLMDSWKIILINLSKWKIWEDNASMVGSFLVTKFQIDAMSRADISFNERREFYLYIDEFQNFATESFENILSEARKYKLSLVVANQYISQINEKIRNAIFGNVWTIITFSLWYEDSQLISSQFKWLVSGNDIVSLPKFKAYAKIMVDGSTTDPFSMSSFPLPDPTNWDEVKQKIIKQSRQRYAIEKERLETLIKNWSEKKFSKTEKAVQKAKEISKSKNNESKNNKSENNKSENNEIKKTENSKSLQNIDDKNTVKLWNWYDWIVKLKYNYWLFVIVWDNEWLLHKKKINVPDWVKWKDMYDISDQIKVYAEDYKEVNWEKKVVWTQLI